MSFYKDENQVKDSIKEHVSPSGKYKLVTSKYSTGKGTWEVSRGIVYAKEGEGWAKHPHAYADRNYPTFWFTWLEGHPKGDFLLCGEDYQGLTCLKLDSGDKWSWAPGRYGFCHTSFTPSADNRFVLATGCYWGAGYDVRIYDLSDPTHFPYKLLDEGELQHDEGDEAWGPNNTVILTATKTIRKSDGKFYHDLTEEEQDPLDEDDSLTGEVTVTRTWTPDIESK